MTSPDYIKLLKLDKLALKSKTQADFLKAAEARRQFARNLGVEKNFHFFVEQAWLCYGDGE